MSTSPDPGLGPPRLPGHRFLQQLGAGGNSQVYLYEQDMPRRKVAVKVLNEAGLTEAVRRQFTAEADAMAGLAGHPHIVQVFTADVAADGRPYLVMQYYPRPNLSVRARREHFSVADVLRIGIQIGSAVETSHHSGILHRDIKPHNILTGQFGTPALTDFGIAARKGAAGPEGMSVPWSPPEILFGTSAGDERADVYSLGATLWHLLAGRSPFEQPGGGNSTLALMRRIQSDPPPRLERADVPGSLERLLRQAMAKDPAARPQTAVDLVRSLQAVEQELRLPLTQPVLPDNEPPARPPVAERPPGFSPGQPVRHQPASADTTRARGVARVDPWAEDAAEDPTRARGAARVDPWGSAAPAPPRRRRQLPAETPEAATGIRPAVAWPAAPAAAEAGDADAADIAAAPAEGHRGRVIGAAVGGILVLAAIVAAVALHGHPAGPVPVSPTGSSTSQSAIGDDTAPGTPDVTFAREGAGEVRFRWTYANREEGDVFRWQRVSGGTTPAAGVTTKPTLVLAAAGGQSVCITVEVVRADGSFASTLSKPACGS